MHKHKDILHHTYAVVERVDHGDLTLRLAALLHDVGKPRTRQITSDGVSFHHHEVVGARMARARLEALRFPSSVIDDVESTPRGPYAGAFGWIAADGRADLGVVIRSLTTAGDGTWTLGTGGGLTVRSDLAEEYADRIPGADADPGRTDPDRPGAASAGPAYGEPRPGREN